MASKVLRQAIYGLLIGDAELQASGFSESNIFPNFVVDGPEGNLFMILRWGTTQRGIGGANPVRLQVWAYNRVPDFSPIADALIRVRALLQTMVGVVMGEGNSVLGINFEGDSDDLYDDGYRAHTRWCEHTVTASGS